MQNKFGEIIGEASMCWVETPTSVFDSIRATTLVQKCMDVVHQEIGMGVTRYSEIMSENAKLKRANEIAVEVLEFYADRDSWEKTLPLTYTRINHSDKSDEGISLLAMCGGKRARQALAEIKGIF